MSLDRFASWTTSTVSAACGSNDRSSACGSNDLRPSACGANDRSSACGANDRI